MFRLKLPFELRALLKSGRWQHPGDAVLRRCIPLLEDPVEFLPRSRIRSARSFVRGFQPQDLATSRFAYGSTELPWLDPREAIFIAINRIPGDDVAIALDYRTGIASPRVVASRWHDEDGMVWFEVAPTFADFCALIGLSPG